MAENFQILLNGEPRDLPGDADIQRLLEQEGLAGRRVAVEVNGEIVHALGGG